MKNKACPNCGSDEFVSQPNQYDILIFEDGDFSFRHSETTDDEFRLYCRECSNEIDQEKSLQQKQVILKTK